MNRSERYLIDASAHARIWGPRPRELWGEELQEGRVALCAPTEIEILSSARSLREHEECARCLRDLYAQVTVPKDVWQELQALQITLADIGSHRSAGIQHLLIAITARRHGLAVLHYDHAFEAIAKHAEIRTCWLAEPGSID
jgi:predicted nucleic acid-binding protein